jgi:hypothetical protein
MNVLNIINEKQYHRGTLFYLMGLVINKDQKWNELKETILKD